MEMITQSGDDDSDSKSMLHGLNGSIDRTLEKLLRTQLANRPLFLMPGSW
jgi:hypothetical protein